MRLLKTLAHELHDVKMGAHVVIDRFDLSSTNTVGHYYDRIITAL